MFTRMIQSVRGEVVELIFRLRAVKLERPAPALESAQFIHPEAPKVAAQPPPSGPPVLDAQDFMGATEPVSAEPAVPVKREEPKVGRNDPCPCGSGKKYKKCHGE